MDEEIKDGIVFRAQVAHVTFCIKMHEAPLDYPHWYEVYSESEKGGLRQINTRIESYDFALSLVEHEIHTLEAILEHKRAGIPTAKQLHFLFCNKIPIPLDLTWGEASDLIEQRLAQIEIEKEARYREKEARKQAEEASKRQRLQQIQDDFQQELAAVPYHAGDQVKHPTWGTGTVLRSGLIYAWVEFANEEKPKLLAFGDLQPA